ncbi:MAG: glycosyltransferase family 2 protein [Actinobacteria bacterium]|nr:glycosyltransferase family 2 protein [Actinomycetota bacterium]
MENKKALKLSIIIVSYNSSNLLEECLDSIFKYPCGQNYGVIVVDNNSSDGSQELVRKKYPGVELITNTSNVGFAAANNMAIKSTDSDFILLLNSDCQVYENSLDEMLGFIERITEAAVVGPKIINSDGSIQYSCRKFPSIIDAGLHSILVNIAPDNPVSRKYKLADISREKPFEVDWVSGSCMLVRRQALLRTGFMDENYFMYVEDIDLCFQMWKKNWKVFYYPHAEILHHVGGSTNVGKVAASVRMQKSILYFFWKNYRKSWKILLIPPLVVVLGLRILLTFIKNFFK